jgi:hypothetical protein
MSARSRDWRQVVTEIVILDEMLQAGMEAYAECKKRKLSNADICVAVYLAMRCLEEMALDRDEQSTVH